MKRQKQLIYFTVALSATAVGLFGVEMPATWAEGNVARRSKPLGFSTGCATAPWMPRSWR